MRTKRGVKNRGRFNIALVEYAEIPTRNIIIQAKMEISL